MTKEAVRNVSTTTTGKRPVLSYEKKNGWFIVNPYIVAGVFGMSFALSWFFGILTTADFVSYKDADVFALELFHIIFAATLVISYSVVWRMSDWFQNHRGTLLAFALVFGSVTLWGSSLFSGYMPWALARVVLTGIGVASLIVLWGEFLCVILGQKVRIALASSLALSFFWYLMLGATASEITPYMVAVLGLISALTYFSLKLTFSLMDDMPSVPAVESDSRMRIARESSVLTFIASLAQGFALYWLLYIDVSTSTISFFIGGLALLMFTFIVADTSKYFFFKESSVRLLFLPILGACILSLFFLPVELWVWPCAAAFIFSLLPYSTALFATCEHIVRCHLSALRIFGFGRRFAAEGLLVGLVLGWFAFSSNMFGDRTLSFWVVVVVMALIIISTTISTSSYYPGEECPEEAKPGVLRIGSNGAIVSDHGSSRNVDTGRKYFQLKCDAVAQQYGLSKRQAEVLHLLAKGRNAEYIQRQLVISQHTAKAHIYNIYQKTGSHSRQDLMDLVENTIVDEDGPSNSKR